MLNRTSLRPASRVMLVLLSLMCSLFVCGAGARTYTIGVEDIDYAPLYSIVDGRYDGYARELLDTFAAAHGDKFEYIPLPVKRLSADFFGNRTLDFKFPDAASWVPEQRVGRPITYSSSIEDVYEGVLVRAEHLNAGVEHLKVLGTLRGFTPVPYLAQIENGSMSISENSRLDGVLRQLDAGRVDGAYVNINVAERMSTQLFGTPPKLVFDHALPYVKTPFSLSTMKHPDMIANLNTFMVRQRKLVNELRVKHGMAPLAR